MRLSVLLALASSLCVVVPSGWTSAQTGDEGDPCPCMRDEAERTAPGRRMSAPGTAVRAGCGPVGVALRLSMSVPSPRTVTSGLRVAQVEGMAFTALPQRP